MKNLMPDEVLPDDQLILNNYPKTSLLIAPVFLPEPLDLPDNVTFSHPPLPSKADNLFSETKDALGHLKLWALIKQILLFRIMNAEKWCVRAKKLVSFCLKNKLPINRILKITVFGQFCGGESIRDCDATITRLAANKIGTILDYSKETAGMNSYDAVTDEILQTIYTASENPAVSFAVFKLTGIGNMETLEKISNGLGDAGHLADFEMIRARANQLCKAACQLSVPILIDAEHSWIQPAIDQIAEEMMAKYNKQMVIVYHTIQLYRHDRLSYLTAIHRKLSAKGLKCGFKLVRGAYMEMERQRAIDLNYPSPIQPTKEATDNDYNRALHYCLKNSADIAICAGTHNQASVALLVSMMEQQRISAKDKKVFFAQLLGMADHITNNLGFNGYHVAKYVPYGKIAEVMPYLFRRMDENKSVAGEISRELDIREIEIRRRYQKTKKC